MNELKVNGTQKFMGIDIPIVEGGFGKDQKVMLLLTDIFSYGTLQTIVLWTVVQS